MNTRQKYPRTFHFPWSQGVASDDKIITSLDAFQEQRVIATIKMDGENTTMYNDYIHARSIDSKNHPSRDWVKNFWNTIRADIPDEMRITCENLYAVHSIKYNDLLSYVMGFGVWNGDILLKWDDVIYWLDLLNIVPVEVVYDDIWNEQKIRTLSESMDHTKNEGIVVRVADEIHIDDFNIKVAKFVRAKHVQTDEHWMNRPVVPNKLRK